MKKLFLFLCLLMALSASAQTRAIAAYDPVAAKTAAQNDILNWMSYLPDDVFVAHVSIPGTHDTTTGHGFNSTGLILATIHASNSQTQSVTLDEQLAGGVRAFDFRPGLSSDKTYLNCNHGISPTKISMDEAFTKLTDYLDAHPGEFFVIHLFRGNVYSSEAPMYAYDSDSDKALYNQLFDEFFNKGKFSNYIVEYSPYLKVKDIRGKMVIFRRDRIDFAHVAKAGNLTNWPGDTVLWSENNKVIATNASDPALKGFILATDISSPSNETELNTELTSITNLFNYNCNQILPNDAKRNGSYKPDWSMIFTSGAYGGENRTGYLKNATYTNPLLTNLIKDADKKGPTGIVFSDWVLVDSYSSYETKGIELIPTIIYNNFDYISDYILDDELFKDNEQIVENYWEEGKQYFMRNVATGSFLSAGAWYGTHAVLNKYGIPITLTFDSNSQTYTINTKLSNSNSSNGTLGIDYYVDNTTEPAEFIVTRAGNGRFLFKLDNKVLGITENSYFNLDGSTHIVEGVDLIEGDESQLWELLEIDSYFENSIKNASKNNGIDISYKISGHQFLGNDNDANNSWEFKSSNAIKEIVGSGNNDHQKMLKLHNVEKKWNDWNWDASWSLLKKIDNLPNGVYRLYWDAYAANISNVSMTVNDQQDLASKFNGNGGTNGNISATDVATAIATGKYTYHVDLIIKDGTINIEIKAPTHSSVTALYLDNFTLIYYGPDPTATCEFLQKVVDDATAKINALPENLREGWENEMAPYNAIIASKDIVGDGSSEAYEIYNLLRERVLQNITEGADFTGAIINNSFELGNGFGWDYSQSDQVDVKPNSDATYTVNNCDGNYLYNTWPKGSPIIQTIPNLPAGHYKLQAMAVTGDTSDDRYVYLLGGNSNSEALKINNDKVNFSEIEYEFDIPETGDAIIGILGGNEDGTYDEFGGYWYKADNFRLIYMGEPQMDSFYDFLRKAIDMATTRINMLPEEYRTGWQEEIAPYEAIIENRTLEGDATKEANEIYALMRAHVYSQNFAGADFTPAITNNSFEWGNTYGWTVTNPRNDTGVKNNSNPIYQVDNCDGEYLFNTWDGDDFGSPINQILPNLPAGKYRLEAMVASDQNNRIWITANNFKNYIQVSTPKTTMHNVELEFTINETQDVTISAVGGTNTGTYWKADGGNWYKVDNFRLTYVSPLEQTITWTMEGSKYDTIILPFGVESEDMPENLYFFSTDSFDDNNGTESYHVLALGNEESFLLPYTPYIVMRADNAYSTRSVVAVDDNTYEFTGMPEGNNEIEYTSGVLTGVLSDTNVEEGHYVVSHGDENSYFTNAGGTVKAYHAYIRNDNPSATPTSPSIYFEAPENIGTGVENIAADDRLVDVFTTTGIKIRRNVIASKALDGLDPGIYILSDGSRIRKTSK